MNIVKAMRDPNLFGPAFPTEKSWRAWIVVLRAIFGLALGSVEAETFRKLTGRSKSPTRQVDEAWVIAGRRAGKSFTVALIAVFLAAMRDWSRYLAPGERGTVMVIASDRKQARVILRYVRGLLRLTPLLQAMVEREVSDAIDLKNRITIEVHAASFRSVRGYSIVCALLDELAFFKTDGLSANPDTEIVEALRPALATVPGSLLIGIGSPYRRAGILWEAHRDFYGKETDDVLVVKAATRELNPTIRQSVIDRAMARDASIASAEWLAEFRSDLQSLLDENWIADAVDPSRPAELPWREGQTYHGFVDPSGGRSDAFTLSIAHSEGDQVIIDLVRGRRPPFDPDSVVAEFSEALKKYKISAVTGDHYSGAWVAQSFLKNSIVYQSSPKPKSALYLEMLPLFSTSRIALPEDGRLLVELRQLERRTMPSGKDSVDHPRGGHDDHANALAGAAVLAGERHSTIDLDDVVLAGRLHSAQPAWRFDLDGISPDFDVEHSVLRFR